LGNSHSANNQARDICDLQQPGWEGTTFVIPPPSPEKGTTVQDIATAPKKKKKKKMNEFKEDINK
jgi:hypothetical protein